MKEEKKRLIQDLKWEGKECADEEENFEHVAVINENKFDKMKNQDFDANENEGNFTSVKMEDWEPQFERKRQSGLWIESSFLSKH